ncbi:MAG: caspase family protein, partial [Proteobacteria bacterium]|nr:caspase family protein [Pseudomonadota bacterium]
EESSKAPPVIVLVSPREDSKVEVNFVQLSGVVEDEKGLKQLEIYINDKPLTKGSDRGIRVVEKKGLKRLEFMERVSLQKGANRLNIRAVDSDGLFTEKTVTVQYIEKLKNVWAVVIGIDKYPHVRQLKYAVNDAGMFYDHLVNRNQIPAENVVLLLNRDATLTKIRSVLGTDMKNKAGKDDMVVIYFAGHGATERDAQSPDGDGLEKYLLPFDVDLKDLYATALPMEELSRIFHRIRSERLIFIADACYSGASGGRTIGMDGMRASISEAFIDRIAGGKGRVIMTASGANEVSAEKDELQHGVFTYFLLQGLQGKADMDSDGLVTVDEAYNYVSKHVPAATAQEQHPVKRGIVEGRLVLSITQ